MQNETIVNENAGDRSPPISVVVASKVGQPFIDQCLESLETQSKQLHAEVIVITPCDEAYVSRIAAEFPWVRIVRAPEIKKIPALRRRGVEEAHGELIAVIEEHCSAQEDWLQQAIEVHAQGQYAAAGGPIADFGYSRLPDWVVYFCEYHGALPPVPEGETADLNDANIAYRKDVLLEHQDLLDDGYWPMTLHSTLLEKGHKLYSTPQMVVFHRGPFPFFYYLRQRYLFSRAFTGVRANNESFAWRLAYLAGAPLMPALMLSRIASRVWSKRCRVKQFIFALPLTMTALVVLVAGEWVGCLFGPGDALLEVE